MKFRKLTIENYKSFQSSTEIVFPENEDGRSIFLIGGMNGAGKTSLLQSIHCCLYGAKAEEIFPNINRRELANGNSQVKFELILEMDDQSELIVQRSWKAGVKANIKPRDLKESFSVSRDGKPLPLDGKPLSVAWTDFIRVEIPKSITTQFFFFDGEKIQEIAADDHFEVKLKTALEAALGIQNIKQLAEDILDIKQSEKKGFDEISDEDLEFKQSELKRERSKLNRKSDERAEIKKDLEAFKNHLEEANRQFTDFFYTEPESKESLKEQKRKQNQLSTRLSDIDSKIRFLSEKILPLAILGRLFEGIQNQIEAERESASNAAIKEHAKDLATRIVRVVEEPEPIFQVKLSVEKMRELEHRIFLLLKSGISDSEVGVKLGLSDKDAARVLNKMETLANSDIFHLKPLLEEKHELELQKLKLDEIIDSSNISAADRELSDQLRAKIEGYSTQVGRKAEQLKGLEEEILSLENRLREIELEIELLHDKHNISLEKKEFMRECDLIISVLNKFIEKLRKNKVNLLKNKTFEMYKLLSTQSNLIKDLTIDESSYEVRIADHKDHEIKKSGLSAGQKEVFAISLLWGLAQTSQLKLPIIIDTPLSRLDSAHRDNIVANYFPRAGEQVIILSTDTEIDMAYYRLLKPHLSGAGSLEFDHQQEKTIFKKGYFWEK